MVADRREMDGLNTTASKVVEVANRAESAGFSYSGLGP